jgi:hypothetical protein
LYSLSASPKANKLESVLDPSFTLRTTRIASVWVDINTLIKAKPTIMPVKKHARKSFVKIFVFFNGLAVF